MKRSKMIEMIAEVMEKTFDSDNGCWEADAEKVLDMMEEHGIVPPLRKRTEEEKKIN
jgi:pentatricopeptide repeat protein